MWFPAATGLAALEEFKIRFTGIACEKEPFLRELVHKAWPQLQPHADLFELQAQAIMAHFDKSMHSGLLLIAGLPCQPFSRLGAQHEWSDPRSGLVPAFIELKDDLSTLCFKKKGDLLLVDGRGSHESRVSQQGYRARSPRSSSTQAASVG